MSGSSKLKTLKLRLGKYQGWRSTMTILILLVIAWLITLGLWSWFFAKRKAQKWFFIILSTALYGWLIYWRANSIGFMGNITNLGFDQGSDWWYIGKPLIATIIMLLLGSRAFQKRKWLDHTSDKATKKYKRHAPGLFSWFGILLCLMLALFLPGWSKLLTLPLFVIFVRLGGLYNPPVREMWVVMIATSPLGGWKEDGKSWWLGNKGWLEGGNFHWTWLPSWLWFINITVLDSSEDVVEWKTPYLPTKAVEVITGTDDGDGDSSPPRVGSGDTRMEPVARGVDVEVNGVWTLRLENPKKFLQLTTKDHNNRDKFLGDLRNTAIARHLHTVTIVGVQDPDFLDQDTDAAKAIMTRIKEASGIKASGWDIGDRNEDPRFKEEQTAYAMKQAELRQAEMDVQISIAEGDAAAARFNADLEARYKLLNAGPDGEFELERDGGENEKMSRIMVAQLMLQEKKYDNLQLNVESDGLAKIFSRVAGGAV